MKPIKDVDYASRAQLIGLLPYGIIAGFVGGGMAAGWGRQPLGLCIIIGAICFVVGIAVPLLIAHGGARTGASIYMPGGSSVPPVREYSLAESLVARGQYHEAIEAYELLHEDNVDHAEPATRLARLLRDKLLRYDDAAAWYKRALLRPFPDAGAEVAVLRELVELYTHKLRTPAAALPHLKRITEKFPQHPAAAWARAEYAEIKQEMRAP